MPKFRKKPVTIEAVQYTGENSKEIVTFMERLFPYFNADNSLVIPTLEGEMKASKGDWIIKGVKGEFYPCKPDIFEATYESIENVKSAENSATELGMGIC